jgi:hypothetical protein
VANTANGKINVYDPTTGAFLGRLADASGETIHIQGLWALHFGNGTVSGDRNALYFTAVGKNHDHGLFGSLRVAPPAAAAMASPPDIGNVNATLAALLSSALSGEDEGSVIPEIMTDASQGGTAAPNSDAVSPSSPQPTGESSAPQGLAAAEDDSAALDSLFSWDPLLGDSMWDQEWQSQLT